MKKLNLVKINQSVFAMVLKLNFPTALLKSLFIAAALILTGCATGPYQQEAKTKSDALLQQQLDKAIRSESKNATPRLWYAGFSLHSQSLAFREDIRRMGELALRIDPNAGLLQLANPAKSQDRTWPYATRENIARTLNEMAPAMGKDDIALVVLTTHGFTNILALNIEDMDYPVIYGQELNRWLKPLDGKRVILVVSACFSGSLIDSLADRFRIILTAAAKDRSSFGCQFNSTNTFFIEELIKAAGDPSLNLEKIYQLTQVGVTRKETMMRLRPPSLPQMWIGDQVTDLSKKPMKDWLKP
jgi:Peptidase C13 family